MLNDIERKLVANRSSEWVGPACWGIVDGYRLNINESIHNPLFG